MSILLETTFGDVVIDLDVDGSPSLCRNVLKLTKARFYTNTLIYNVVPGRYCQMGDPKGDGTGGCSIYGLIDSYQSSSDSNSKRARKTPPDVTQSQRRFLQSQGRLLTPSELGEKGVVIAMEMGNVRHTIGSQFLFTLSDDNGLKDLVSPEDDGERNGNNNNGGRGPKRSNHRPRYLSLGTIAEDSQNVLSKLDRSYCDDDGRPFADARIRRALVLHDPFEEDPKGMEDLMRWRGITVTSAGNNEKKDGDTNDDDDDDVVTKEGYPLAPQSPTYERPPEEIVPVRIQADDTTQFASAGWDDDDADNDEARDSDEEDDEARQKRLELQAAQEKEWSKRQDTSRAVMLEMLGDRPDAEIEAPENVLFVCKLNPLTNDEDLELIFSRFDPAAEAEIIRDPDSGVSLQYAFVEFASNEACNEAYLKMNNALVDDRRIRVDFSQSVAKVWDRYAKRYRMGDKGGGVDRGFMDGGGGGGRGRGGGGRGRGSGRGQGRGRGRGQADRGGNNHHSNNRNHDRPERRPDRYQENRQAAPPPRHDDQRRMDPVFDDFGRVVRPRGGADGSQRNLPSPPDKEVRGHNRHPRGDSRSPSRDRGRDDAKGDGNGRIRSSSRQRDRRSRSRSNGQSSDDSRRRGKKHRKHRHHRDGSSSRRDGSRRKRSRSHDREKKRKKHQTHHRGSSSSRHHREREYSDEDGGKRSKHHRRHHRRGHDDEGNDRRDRRSNRSRSRS